MLVDVLSNVLGPNTSIFDSFGRLRIGAPFTIFDSKQLNDSDPLRWDDSEVSGTGTSSTYNTNQASTTLAVSANTAGNRVRQTFMRFNYQPGKSQLILMTGVLGTPTEGVTQSLGYYDDDNGIFFKCEDAAMYLTIRTKTSGSVVDGDVAQASWNVDPFDGTGPSGITLDFSKTQIFFIDIEWLGVGSVRTGFIIDGHFYVAHIFDHANDLDIVYMSSPNLPVRYEIDNDGTGAAADLTHICSTVISEGGTQDNGVLRYASTGATHVDANSANTIYAVVGLRLKSTHLSSTVKLVSASMISETNDDFEWMLIWNPTVAGTFTYSDETNACTQTATGATANTVTGGTYLTGGYGKSNVNINLPLANALTLGAAIDGTRDELVLCVRPLSANADIMASLSWRELV